MNIDQKQNKEQCLKLNKLAIKQTSLFMLILYVGIFMLLMAVLKRDVLFERYLLADDKINEN